MFQIFLNTPANFGKRPAEENHPVVFVLVANFAPAFVITVLLPSACVEPDCLEMSIPGCANPHLFPGGWNDQGFDSAQLLCVTNRLARAIVDVTKAFYVP